MLDLTLLFLVSVGAAFISPEKGRLEAPVRGRSLECYISPLTTAKGMHEGRIAIVDVRRREDFLRYRVRGALNIPGYAVKTKSFLRGKAIVLVNEGRVHRQLEKVCGELTAKGFGEVRILRGGLHAWRTKVGPLEGDHLAQRELSIMDPQELSTAMEERPWLLVNVSAEAESAIDGLPGSVRVPGGLGSDQFVEHLRLAVSRRAAVTGVAPDVLIVDRAGEQHETFNARVDAGSLRGTFYLRGGASGYQAHLAMQKSMWAREAKPPERRSSCTSP